jgi:hypothetical protein
MVVWRWPIAVRPMSITTPGPRSSTMGEFGQMLRMIAVLVVIVIGLATATAIQSDWSSPPTPSAPSGAVPLPISARSVGLMRDPRLVWRSAAGLRWRLTPDLSRQMGRLLGMSRATPGEREQSIRAAARLEVVTVADMAATDPALVAELERRAERRRLWLARS